MNRKKWHTLLAIILINTLSSCAGEMSVKVRSFILNIEHMRTKMSMEKSESVRLRIMRSSRAQALKLLDTDSIARLTLGKYYNRLSEDQKEDFVELFHELMAHQVVKAHFPPDVILSTKTKIKLISEKKQWDETFRQHAYVVRTRYPHKDVFFFIDFYLHKNGKTYKLYDIHIDGASILLDYRKHFYSIIKRKGIAYLIDRLRDKVEHMDD